MRVWIYISVCVCVYVCVHSLWGGDVANSKTIWLLIFIERSIIWFFFLFFALCSFFYFQIRTNLYALFRRRRRRRCRSACPMGASGTIHPIIVLLLSYVIHHKPHLLCGLSSMFLILLCVLVLPEMCPPLLYLCSHIWCSVRLGFHVLFHSIRSIICDFEYNPQHLSKAIHKTSSAFCCN